MGRRVSCIPSGDEAFRNAATVALGEIDGRVEVEGIAAALADVLRPTYEAVTVNRQDLLARVFDDDVWYAYRDGKPFGSRDPASPRPAS
jgi:hypothetical protein